MFGLFKKKDYTKELLSLVISQNNVIEKLAVLMPLLADKTFESIQQQKSNLILDKICGEWFSKDLSISVKIRKEKSGYYACIDDLGIQSKDFKISHAIRTYKGMSYFVLSGYAIFLEYNEGDKMIYLEGSLTLTQKNAVSDDLTNRYNPN